MDLVEVRVKRRKTQWEISRLTGINQTKLSLIENGYVSPSDEEKQKIAKALEFGLEEIDYGRIALNALKSLGAEFAGGALANKFLSLLTPKLASSSVSGIMQPLNYTPTQKTVTDFLGNAIGQDMLNS